MKIVAINPQHLAKNVDRSNVLRHFGFDKGRLLARLPLKWERTLRESEYYKELDDDDQKHIETFLEENYENNNLFAESRSYRLYGSWCDSANHHLENDGIQLAISEHYNSTNNKHNQSDFINFPNPYWSWGNYFFDFYQSSRGSCFGSCGGASRS